jgi:hypothetical protein
MVTIPKNSVLNNAASLTGPKGVPATRVSSLAETTVESMEGSSSISLDNSDFEFSENTDANLGPGNGNDQPHLHYPNSPDIPTQAFDTMLQRMDIPRALSDHDNSVPGFSVPFVGLIAKAIAIYENNARAYNGESAMRGTSFSMVL